MENLVGFFPPGLPECMSCERVGELRLCGDCGCAVCGMVTTTAVGDHVRGCRQCGQEGGWWVHGVCWAQAAAKVRSKIKGCNRCGRSFIEVDAIPPPPLPVATALLQPFSLTSSQSAKERKVRRNVSSSASTRSGTREDATATPSSFPLAAKKERSSRVVQKSTAAKTLAEKPTTIVVSQRRPVLKKKTITLPPPPLSDLLENFEVKYTSHIIHPKVARGRPLVNFIESCADYPGYKDLIPHPICLDDIATKVRSGAYLPRHEEGAEAVSSLGVDSSVRQANWRKLPVCLQEWSVISRTLPADGTGHRDMSVLCEEDKRSPQDEQEEPQEGLVNEGNSSDLQEGGESVVSAARNIFFGIRADLLLMRKNCIAFNSDHDDGIPYIQDAREVCAWVEEHLMTIFLRPVGAQVTIKEEVISDEEEDAVPVASPPTRTTTSGNKQRQEKVTGTSSSKETRKSSYVKVADRGAPSKGTPLSADRGSSRGGVSGSLIRQEEEGRKEGGRQKRNRDSTYTEQGEKGEEDKIHEPSQSWLVKARGQKKMVLPSNKHETMEEVRGMELIVVEGEEEKHAAPVPAIIEAKRTKFERQLTRLQNDPRRIAVRQTVPSYWTFDALHFGALSAPFSTKKSSNRGSDAQQGEGKDEGDAGGGSPYSKGEKTGLEHLNAHCPMDIEMDPETAEPIRVRHYLYSQPKPVLPADTINYTASKIPEILGPTLMGILQKRKPLSLEVAPKKSRANTLPVSMLSSSSAGVASNVCQGVSKPNVNPAMAIAAEVEGCNIVSETSTQVTVGAANEVPLSALPVDNGSEENTHHLTVVPKVTPPINVGTVEGRVSTNMNVAEKTASVEKPQPQSIQEPAALTFAEQRAQRMQRNKERLGKLNIGK